MGITTVDTLSMIKSQKWPLWPFLPVKRNGGNSCGVIVADGYSLVVYMTNVMDLPKTPEGWQHIQSYKYDSHEQLVQDGWEVD